MMLPRAIWLALVLMGLVCAASGQEPLFRLTVNGQPQEGTPLLFNEQQVFFLTRSGRLLEFAPQDATDFARASGTFKSYSPAELRGQLLREFGSGSKSPAAGGSSSCIPRVSRTFGLLDSRHCKGRWLTTSRLAV
jgi:hypothetical protein